jgi:hypothetical protein
MQQSPDFAGTIWQALTVLLTFIWNWSFGQIVTMFQMPFNTLPLWKQGLFVIVTASLAHLSYKVAKGLRNAAQLLVGAVVGLISAFLSVVPQIAWVGLVTFGSTWVILNLDPVWIPAGLR